MRRCQSRDSREWAITSRAVSGDADADADAWPGPSSMNGPDPPDSTNTESRFLASRKKAASDRARVPTDRAREAVASGSAVSADAASIQSRAWLL